MTLLLTNLTLFFLEKLLPVGEKYKKEPWG